jgi:S-adenosylmethionine:tRNA ribosyltransferase-isomerase
LKTVDFDYNLPKEYIAQHPAEPRDSSRLMVVDRISGRVKDHTVFSKLGDHLNPGDLLVINQTLVIPARLYGRKAATGGRVEILLLRRIEKATWECLVGGKGLTPGTKIQFEMGITAVIIEVMGGAKRLVEFSEPLSKVIDGIGKVPLPPYIQAELKEPGKYQTVYAKEPGSVAAPTAGLHFTPGLISQIKSQGVNFATVTLHIGLDTFLPVTEEEPENHKIHSEWCVVPAETVDKVNQTKKKGGRIIAVGTTSVRALESSANVILSDDGFIGEYSGFTRLFILPGYVFKVVDAMITNFHLPRSSLIMLVSAYLGRENVITIYECAKNMGYRFYSFGDAMFIVG